MSRRFSQQTQTGRAASEYTPELAKITAPHCGLSKRIGPGPTIRVVVAFSLTTSGVRDKMRDGTGVPPVNHAQDAPATTKPSVSPRLQMMRKAISALTMMVL